jgi:molybdopterin synthase catalytic subunit
VTRELDVRIDSQAIRSDELREAVWLSTHGAISMFEGIVRSPNRNVEVEYLEYEAWPLQAIETCRAILMQASKQYDLGGAAVRHRTGRVFPGEVALGVAVSAKHRQESFQAIEFIVDAVKAEAPIWKLEVTETGSYWEGLPQRCDWISSKPVAASEIPT